MPSATRSGENDLHVDPIQVDVGTATGLCVPAVRQLVPTCQLCSNGCATLADCTVSCTACAGVCGCS